MRDRSRLVFRPEYADYNFGPQHPLRPERFGAGLELFEAAGLGPQPDEWLAPPPATPAELGLVHTSEYLDAVQRLSDHAHDPLAGADGHRWGLGPGDTPAFPGMHAATAAVVGGTLHAVLGVLDGAFDHAFNPAGGLHHAFADRASGFCVYDDPAVAIAAAVQRGARVLYVDVDAHHGDGVQAIFYEDPRVLTLSIHETGHHLFPGTGFVEELGSGPGLGYSLNLPMEPYTEDASWLDSLQLVLDAVAERFQPDLIVSQHGCDPHTWDPLTHLRLSTRAFAAESRLIHELAHRLAQGRWVALGGGGYDWIRVVPRNWAILWAEMTGQELPETIPRDWSARWATTASRYHLSPLPERFLDDPHAWPPFLRRIEIERLNRDTASRVRRAALTGGD
ncbi:MAG: acetoin utilization protein AcuC [Chloroflexi bacterium]|nr:acetoin utilization protein AcuC [Chloroflexota bacterium]